MGRRNEPWRRDGRRGWWATIGGRKVRLDVPDDAPKRDATAALMRSLTAPAPPAASPTVEFLVDKLMEHVSRHRAPLTAEWYGRHLGSFGLRFGAMPAADVRPMHVAEWLDAHPWGQSTRSGATAAVKRLFRWSKAQGYLAADPVEGVERPAIKAREKILTAEQFRAILAAVPDRQFTHFLEALWETGCRPSELFGVTAADLDARGRTLAVVNKTRHKRSPTRTVYLTDRATVLLRGLARLHKDGPLFRNRRGTAWTRFSVKNRFAFIREKLGYGGEATAYALRHLYVTDALEKEVPIATVAELVGHADTRMVSRVYSKLRERSGHLAAAAEKVRGE